MSGSAPCTVSNLGINNFNDPVAVLRACFRVAKPDATVVVTTNLVGHMAEFYEPYRTVLIDWTSWIAWLSSTCMSATAGRSSPWPD